MNIHFFHPNPNMNARMLPDVWLLSDIKEVAQIMSTICSVNETWTEQMYKPYNPDGRFVKWGLEKTGWMWMLRYASFLGLEYAYRTRKTHKSMNVLQIFLQQSPLHSIDTEEPTFFPEAFLDYRPKGDTVFERYRNYLLLREKDGLKVKWTKRRIPEWYIDMKLNH